MRRRLFLHLAAGIPALGQSQGIRREVFLKSPGHGTAVMAYAYYTGLHGGGMMSIEQRWSRSDTVDAAYVRRSTDYGSTWSEPVIQITGEKRKEGMHRRHPRGGWVDPHNGRFIEFWMEGTLPSDDPLEGLRQWRLFYQVSGGPVRQLIHKGKEFSPEHPLPGVYTGKNCAMLGDHTSRPLSMPDGSFLMPVDISPLGPDGALANPGGGYTYHHAAVLHARWKGTEIEWELSKLVAGDPARSTRGMSESSIASISKDHLILVMRGSNDRKPQLPSYRWISHSRDGGWGWTAPVPWTYTDGSPFYSPSSCSQLLPHSNGKVYWLGNITPENPRGNRPRYPFVVGEVDLKTGLLLRESIRMVDDLQAGGESCNFAIELLCS